MYRCIFCQMVEGEVKCNKVYEDEDVFAYLDWNPWSEKHIVIFPKKHIGLQDKDDPEFAVLRQKLLDAVPQVAKSAGCENDYQLFTEETEEHLTQNEEHLHFHIVGGNLMDFH